MIIDLIAAVLVLLLAYLGWRRGLLLSVLPIVGLACGYGAAWLLHGPAGRLLGSLFSLQPLLSYPLGGAVAFVLTMVLFGIIGLVLRRRRRRRLQGRPPHLADRISGALFGGAYGAAVVLLAAWAVLTAMAVAGGFDSLKVRDSLTGRLALPLVERMARRVAGGQTRDAAVTSAAASFARDPAQTTRDLSGVLTDRRVQSVLQDRRLMRTLARQPDQAARDPKLRSLARDPRFVEKLQRLGLVRGAEAGDLSSQEVQRQLVERLRPAARLAGELSDDPEVQRLVKDPDLLRLLERRDLMALANDARFNRLAEIVVGHLRRAASDAAPAP